MRGIYLSLTWAALLLGVVIATNLILGTQNADLARRFERVQQVAQNNPAKRAALRALAGRISEFPQNAELKALLQRLQLTVTPDGAAAAPAPASSSAPAPAATPATNR
jgi:hypothetical protein